MRFQSVEKSAFVYPQDSDALDPPFGRYAESELSRSGESLTPRADRAVGGRRASAAGMRLTAGFPPRPPQRSPAVIHRTVRRNLRARRAGGAACLRRREPRGKSAGPCSAPTSPASDRSPLILASRSAGRAALLRRRACRSRSCRPRSTRRRSRPAMLAEARAAARRRRRAGRAQGAPRRRPRARTGWCSAPTRCWSATAGSTTSPRTSPRRARSSPRCAAGATSSCPPRWSSRTARRSGGTSAGRS